MRLSREMEKEDVDLIQEYYDKGGEITLCEKFARTENLVISQFKGKKKKK